MSPATVLRVVVLPQAFRVMIPPLGNSLNGLLKTTTLVSIISVEELLRLTQYAVQVNFRALEGYVAAACYYLVMTSIWSVIQGRIEAAINRGHGGGPARRRPAAGLQSTEFVGETR
jgi:polar amino acid transport system permease protein